MATFNVDLAALPDDDAQLEAIRHHAHTLGAIMAVSHYFCPAGTYWADIIAPGHATLAQGPTPLAAALTALDQFAEATAGHVP
jgi:hypothetical protein